jgi:hypothetical protein
VISTGDHHLQLASTFSGNDLGRISDGLREKRTHRREDVVVDSVDAESDIDDFDSMSTFVSVFRRVRI